MSRNDIILGAVALVLIAFSLVASLVVPRRRPDFPGERLGLFVGICVLLVVAMLAAVEVFGEEDEEAEAADIGSVVSAEGETGAATTGEETTVATEGGGAQGDVARGEELFASEGCGSCHTLAAAGTSGTVGPNLDELQPDLDAAVAQITNGGGGMPPYGGQLSEADIKAIAAYIVASTQ
jgi:mono/diheme cytochrome c family protein